MSSNIYKWCEIEYVWINRKDFFIVFVLSLILIFIWLGKWIEKENKEMTNRLFKGWNALDDCYLFVVKMRYLNSFLV